MRRLPARNVNQHRAKEPQVKYPDTNPLKLSPESDAELRSLAAYDEARHVELRKHLFYPPLALVVASILALASTFVDSHVAAMLPYRLAVAALSPLGIVAGLAGILYYRQRADVIFVQVSEPNGTA
jgi:hypothetical protein